MEPKQKQTDFSLIDLAEIVWNGKLQLVGLVLFAVSGTWITQQLGPSQTYLAKTEIKPILLSDAEEYRRSNLFGFFTIISDEDVSLSMRDSISKLADAGVSDAAESIRSLSMQHRFTMHKRLAIQHRTVNLEKLFREQLVDRPTLAALFQKYNFVERKDYKNDADFERALFQLTSKVMLVAPKNSKKNRLPSANDEWTIQFEYHNEEKWLRVLQEAKNIANKRVQQLINKRFDNLLLDSKQRQEELVRDLNFQIAELNSQYQTTKAAQLANLKDQWEIARALNIEDYIEAPSPVIFQNLTPETMANTYPPLYFQGYKSLGKKIELLERERKFEVVVPEVTSIQQQINFINKDPYLENAANLFELTPAASTDKFKSARLVVATTEFTYSGNRLFALVLAAIAATFIGVLYLVIGKLFHQSSRDSI